MARFGLEAWKVLSITEPKRRKEQRFRFEDYETEPHKFYSGEEPRPLVKIFGIFFDGFAPIVEKQVTAPSLKAAGAAVQPATIIDSSIQCR